MSLIVDDQDRLRGTLVDGDIRRAVLGGKKLDGSIEGAMNRNPVTARAEQPLQSYLDLMVKHVVQQLPIVDDQNRMVDLVLGLDIDSVFATSPKAVIMAGGLGTRLRPLTEHMPKPMLPIGDLPIMDHILKQLREGGVREVVVSTHYKGEMIEEALWGRLRARPGYSVRHRRPAIRNYRRTPPDARSAEGTVRGCQRRYPHKAGFFGNGVFPFPP